MLSQPCKEKVGAGQGQGLENYPNAPLQNSKYSTQERRRLQNAWTTSKGGGSFGKEDTQFS